MKELFSAFIKFQSEFKGLRADASNPFFKSNYIKLDGILEAVRPLLAKHGLAVIQNAHTTEEGLMAVKTILIHESGQSMETDVMTMRPTKDDPQQRGSVVTYMKRYQLGALVGVCESVDDDGNLATHGKSQPEVKQQTKNEITTNSIKTLHAIRGELGKTEEEFKAGLSTMLKRDIKSIKDITEPEAKNLIKTLSKKVKERKVS